jgi:hypothetical protein
MRLLTGTLVPLPPGEPEILTGIISVYDADVIRIHFYRSLQTVFED